MAPIGRKGKRLDIRKRISHLQKRPYCLRPGGGGGGKPHNVPLWGLGNELYGDWQIGHKSAREYAPFAREVAKVVKSTSPGVELVANGGAHGDLKWNQIVLDKLADHVEYLSMHEYVGNRNDNFAEYMAVPLTTDRYLTTVSGTLKASNAIRYPKKPVYLAFDEWNVWYRTGVKEALEETYNLEDALVVAMYFHNFFRYADILKIANLAQMVNVIAPILTKPDGLILQTIFYPFELYSRCAGRFALDLHVECPGYKTDLYEKVPYVDAAGTFDPDTHQLALFFVNRHPKDAIEVELEMGGVQPVPPFTRFEIAGEDVKTANTFEHPNQVTCRKTSLDGPCPPAITLPAHTIVVLTTALKV